LTCPRQTEIRRLDWNTARRKSIQPLSQEVSEDHGRQSHRRPKKHRSSLRCAARKATVDRTEAGARAVKPRSRPRQLDERSGLTPTALGERSREVMSTPGARDANVGCRSRVEASWRRVQGKAARPSRDATSSEVEGQRPGRGHQPFSLAARVLGCTKGRKARLRPFGGSPGEQSRIDIEAIGSAEGARDTDRSSTNHAPEAPDPGPRIEA
jgi:hypothetical protein